MPVLKEQSLAPGDRDLENLLKATSKGDRDSFAALYKRTSAKLFGIVRRICNSEETAQEALQESYVLIWKNAGLFNSELASPLTWMARIARNKAIDIRRLQSERISTMGVELDLDAPGSEEDPLAATQKNEELRRLSNCLKELGEDRREMILLAYYQGLSREELGARFEKPVNTVKTLLRRGLAQLKECLDGHD